MVRRLHYPPLPIGRHKWSLSHQPMTPNPMLFAEAHVAYRLRSYGHPLNELSKANHACNLSRSYPPSLRHHLFLFESTTLVDCSLCSSYQGHVWLMNHPLLSNMWLQKLASVSRYKPVAVECVANPY